MNPIFVFAVVATLAAAAANATSDEEYECSVCPCQQVFASPSSYCYGDDDGGGRGGGGDGITGCEPSPPAPATTTPSPPSTPTPTPVTPPPTAAGTTLPPVPVTSPVPSSPTSLSPTDAPGTPISTGTTTSTAPSTTLPSAPATSVPPAPPTPPVSPSASPATTTSSSGSSSQYSNALALSMLFYDAQRSGRLPPTNRVPWRGDSALGDSGLSGEDLTGGFYDAGDHVKFNFPLASTLTILAWGGILWPEGYAAAGQTEYLRDTIKWGLDYFIKCHVNASTLYAQVGDGNVDHAWWGRPEDMTMARPAFAISPDKPGSDLAAGVAAAFAAGSIIWAPVNASYAAELVQHALDLFDFANKYQGVYSNSVPAAAPFYPSYSGFHDELVWASVWLYKATNNVGYLATADLLARQYAIGAPTEFSWDDATAGALVLLAQHTGKPAYQAMVDTFMAHWTDGGVVYSPLGLAFSSQWGVLRYAANAAFIGMATGNATYAAWGKTQIDYILGLRPNQTMSFMVGFGKNYPTQPQHRAASCPWPPAQCDWSTFALPDPNPHVLLGAVVGGPSQTDAFTNNRADYVTNEAACDYNAGLSGALAALIE